MARKNDVKHSQKEGDADDVVRDAALQQFGRRLRALREKEHSQEDFALLAGLNRGYYGTIERGEQNVSVLNLMKIAAYLGVEVGELFPPVKELQGLFAETTPVVRKRSTRHAR